MWGHKSSHHGQSSPSYSKFKLNSTASVLPSSPMVTRRRHEVNSSLLPNQNGTPGRQGASTKNVLAGAGPLLSSPFMPQIKRALGLEPKIQNKYGEQRRHSLGIGITPKSPTVTAGSLPHVRLNKTRRLSLSERNSSMLNKSSTVKIAPPVIGKVSSPSLYHLRCNTSLQEDRGTPDTYAVISALKERRKRSINTFDEHTEPPQQQAKRRRQESQHSNASTSSMPSMPENFPDLSSADFNMRLETPSLKRPSRPSQEDIEEWDTMNSSKRLHHECRNNSILSSLSSSQRFIENQISKRKAESSFHEKENDSYVAKSQRKEPPKLTHLDVQYSTENTEKNRTPTVPQVREKSPQITNGHSTSTSQKAEDAEKTSQSKKTVEPCKQPVLPRMPSMKKTASIYSGLSSPSSFKKAQYANVVATLDDYDADREAENQRVKQMLKDLDDSFTKKEAKQEAPVTSTSTLSAVTTTVSVAASTLVSVAPTTSAITLETTKPSSVLSALEKLSKSPVQETGGVSNTTAATTQPNVSFKPLFGTPSTTQSTVSSAPTGSLSGTAAAGVATLSTSQPVVSAGTQSSLSGSSTSAPGGFTFVTPKTTQSVGGLPNYATATSATSGFTLGGAQAPSQTKPSTGVGIVFGAASSAPSAAPSQTQPSAGSGFGFGTVATSTNAPSGAGGFSFAVAQSTPATAAAATTTTTKAPGFGFGSVTTTTASAPATAGFGFNTGSVQTSAAPSAAPSAGFSFASKPAGTTTAATGFSFGAAGSTAPSTGGFSLAGQAAPAVSTVASSQLGTASTASAPTFNFSGATSSAASGLFGTSSGTAPATSSGFSFSVKPSTASVASPFGTPAVSTAQSPFAVPVSTSQTPFGAPTGSTAAAFSFGAAKTTAPASPFSFNAGSTATTAGSTPFQTGQTTGSAPAATGLFAFGGTATTAAPAFGATTTQSVFGTTGQTPAFGSTSQTPAFGSTSQTPAFGTANPAPAFGSASQTPAFGSANQTPAFGSANQTPAFGSVNQTPAFGSTNQPPAFGAANQAPAFGSATPAFGAAPNQKPSTPVFGATATSTSGSVFGSTGSTATGFAKSHSMPVFVTSQDNASSTGTFNFGGPAPNVNPFGQGQTTPAKQTGAAFGQVTNDTTPKAQTGAMFNFGQTNNSAVKGFDFSASTAPGAGSQSGTGGYNFMASASVPVFNFGSTGATPAAGPTFGAPGSTPGAFAMGGGSVPPRPPRAVARANRRRPQRK